MKYDVFIIIKRNFVMLLINLKIYKIDECEKVNEKIKNAINKNIRENVLSFFDRETIFVYNIDFFDVVNEKTNEINEKNETNEINFFDFFA